MPDSNWDEGNITKYYNIHILFRKLISNLMGKHNVHIKIYVSTSRITFYK